MPLTNPAPGTSGSSLLGLLGLMATTPQATPSGYATTGYAETSKTMPAYTPNVQSSSFVGGLLDLLSAARLADLNALRVAVENQRALAEGTAKNVNALREDLKALGLISS
jgi:hypothetical protein